MTSDFGRGIYMWEQGGIFHILEIEVDHIHSEIGDEVIFDGACTTLCGIKIADGESIEDYDIDKVNCDNCIDKHNSGNNLFISIDSHLKEAALI